MRTKLTIVLASAGLLLAAWPLRAHHSFAAEFDVHRPIKMRGTVTRLGWINPHSWIYIDVKGPDGKIVNWMIEGGSPNALLRLGFTKDALPVGSEIVVEGFQAKDGSNRGVGQSVSFADGRKLFLGGSAPGANGPEK
ncbi:conserved exported hypothetical protein [Candidatus Sulfopaludibacter sp. SbA4]|nr:conserved exported hypothetical protein [Candidatus Sulfopaludibacter sp. SbA4]